VKKVYILLLLTLIGVSTTINTVGPVLKYDKEATIDKSIFEDVSKGLLNSVLDMIGGALSVAEDVAHSVLSPVQSLIKQYEPAIIDNPYQGIPATVRCGEPICDLELAFRDLRFPKVKAAQERLLGMTLKDEDVLEVAFACSGGGWRAMCCSLGSCLGAEKIGLLDATMYVSALSGSTWFLGPWLASGMDLTTYKQRALEVASQGIDLRSISDVGPMIDNLWVKFAYNQPLNIIDLYGGLLGNALLRDLGKDCHAVYLSDQKTALIDGDLPMPIHTATLGERRKAEFWFEFTPYEVGSRWLCSYVPTWAFGRHFKKGKSLNDAPEQSLGFFMGIYGSAFAADFEDVYDIILDGIEFPSFLKNVPFAETIFKAIKKVFSKMAYASDLGDIRVAWSRVPNFVYKMHGVPHNNYKELKLVDAGLDFNNPVFSTYRKPPFGDAPDIIFIFDAGSSGGSYEEMKRLVNYAKYNGIKFPKIDYFEPGKQIMSIFKDDDDLDVPVVVYMPRINGFSHVQKSRYRAWYDYYLELLDDFDMEKAVSSGFATTFNFDYTKQQAEQLMAATEFNIVYVAEKVKEIMAERITARRELRRRKENKK